MDATRIWRAAPTALALIGLLTTMIQSDTPRAEAAPTGITGGITRQSPTIQGAFTVSGSGTYHVQAQLYRTDTWAVEKQVDYLSRALPLSATADFGAGVQGRTYQFKVYVKDTSDWSVVTSQWLGGAFTCCTTAPAPTPIPPTATPTRIPSTPTPIPPTSTPAPTATATRTPTRTSTATPTPSSSSCLGAPRYAEQRPENATANSTYVARDPSQHAQTWPDYTQTPSYDNTYYPKVDANGCLGGTTEQILEWAARKWFGDVSDATFQAQVGLSDVSVLDWFKAQAVEESSWRQSKVGDFNSSTGQYDSFGILQVRRPWWPMAYESRLSTPLNADLAASRMRADYDGVTYLTATRNNPRQVVYYYCECGQGYVDLWVQRLRSRPWKVAGF